MCPNVQKRSLIPISDLVAVVMNYPGILLCIIFLLRGDYALLVKWAFYLDFVTIFYAYSFLLLLVMSIDQYLGAYYPIFHRTSVTRRRLLTFLAMLLISYTTLHVFSTSDMIISRISVVVIFAVVVFLPLVYLNFKLFKITREVRRRKAALPEKRTTINLKNISSFYWLLPLFLYHPLQRAHTLFLSLCPKINSLRT